ncbi:MAG TPA: hypothetical protein VJ719_07925 [Chthoniobacterales bacterium]|nr:hypothetical protein [Chthoniobacterales bacterium]
MTRLRLLFCFFLTSAGCAFASQQRIAFERGTEIWVANADGSNASKICKGTGPDISADGKRIAFHTDSSSDKDLVRHIAVADVATKKVTVFKKEIPSDNCQRAVWSPDGAHILFSIWSDADWHLGLVNADGSGFRYVKKSQNKNSLWSYCWAPDGRGIYAQDLTNLYLIDANGNVQKQWTLKTLFPGGSFNSGSSFAVSTDGKKMLMEVDMDDEEANMPDWDGPPPSIWALDIGSEKATRLTPRGVLAWHPAWIDATAFVFGAQTPKDKKPSIFRATLDNPERKVLIKNGTNPSASR